MIEASDYIFYRFCKFYSSTGNKQTIISYASALVAAVQVFTILSLITIFSFFVEFELPGKIFAFVTGIIFLGFNWYRYERRIGFEIFAEKWDNEEKGKRKVKGYLIVVYTVFVILFPMVIGYLRHNVGLIN